MPITVLLAEDDPMVRAALRVFLGAAGGFEVVAEASDGMEAVRLSGEVRPDVAVMDIGLPTLDGLEATRRILSASPSMGVVVLSGRSDETIVEAARAAGAAAVVPKERAFELLDPALRSAAALDR